MCRNGACCSISRSAAISSASTGVACPRNSTAPSAIVVSCDGSALATLAKRSAVNGLHSLRVVKDHAEGMAVAGTDPADAMAEINAIVSARPRDRPVMHSKSHRIALRQRHHFRPRLHARPLLRQHEFAAGEISSRFRQQDRDLQREYVFTVEILMQAIVVAFAILQQQRRRPLLAGGMATPEEGIVTLGIADIDAHRLVPAIGDLAQPPIQRRPQFRDQGRQRIGKILVLAAPETVSSHHDPAAKLAVVGIERGEYKYFSYPLPSL